MKGFDSISASVTTTVVVVGGGASGLVWAGMAARRGRRVIVLERNRRMARKLLITGKGRCNITNNCDVSGFIANVPQNGRFLYSSLGAFNPQDMMQILTEQGLELKTERGNRVFPKSDKARDVVDALVEFARNAGCKFLTGRATNLLLDNGYCSGVQTETGEKIMSDAVVVCTGGLSYPLTGSTGDGYALAKQAGHTVIPPRPSLVPLESSDKWCADVQGLSFDNCAIKVIDIKNKKIIFEDFGEMLFTHFGVSGPMVLSASAHMRQMQPNRYQLLIDLKPALSAEKLDARLIRDLVENKNREFANSLGALLPHSLCPVVVSLSGIAPDTRCHSITKEQRRQLGKILKALPVNISGFRPIEEAIITSGGVKVSEINAKTMQSKLVKGLYFAGEVLDVDAYTGGFNLQIAFSTGAAAGNNVG